MKVWKKTGSLAVALLMVAVGLVLALSLAQIGPAAGSDSATTAAAPPPARPPAASNSVEQGLPGLVPQGVFVDVASEVQPAVVFIESERTSVREGMSQRFEDFFGPFFRRRDSEDPEPEPEEFMQSSQGSGVIVDPSGYILTNTHVVASLDREERTTVEAETVTVTLSNEKEYEATIVGVDLGTDIAVLKIEPSSELPHLGFGDSDEAQVGEWVLAIGAPFGFRGTVSAGIISGKSRGNLAGLDARFQDFLQTDAAINPGNSGGPLVNLRGQIIGINTAIATNGFAPTNLGVGFAVPVNMARRVMDQLIEHGRVVRGWLGVTVQDAGQELLEAFGIDSSTSGVVVGDVREGEPAALGGLQNGDVVIGINGAALLSLQHFLQQVARTPPGEAIDLKVLRGGDELSIRVVLGERPSEESIILDGGRGPRPEREQEGDGTVRGSADLGLRVSELTERIGRQLNVEPGETGIVVTEVRQNSVAFRAGLRRGDLILTMNRQPLTSVDEFEELAGGLQPGSAVAFYVHRADGSHLFFASRLPRE